jgi:transposase
MYSPELRAEVVRAVREEQLNYADAARRFGLVAETVRNWVVADEKNLGGTPQAQEAIERARIAELERRVRELEQENAFMEKAAAFFARKLR